MEQDVSSSDQKQLKGHIEAEFAGSSTPKRPELKWFAYDDNINKLIEMRCNNANSIKSEKLKLSGASSATMSQKTAYAIDTAIGKLNGIKGNASMDIQAAKEHGSELVFHIEF